MEYLFLLAIAPVIFLLSYIKKKDPNPEPKDLLKKIFIFGCLTVIPVIILEVLYDHFFIPEGTETESFADVFLGVAFIEEFFKWLVVYILCFKSKHFDETYDAIVYSAYSSLAFACIENIGFVILGGGIVGILRALTAVPGHLCHGIIMGYFIGKARLNKSQNKSIFLPIFCSLFLSTLAHCIYDYLIEIKAILAWLIFFVTLVIFCIIVVKRTAKNNVAISDSGTTQGTQPAEAEQSIQTTQTTQETQSTQSIQDSQTEQPTQIIPAQEIVPQATSVERSTPQTVPVEQQTSIPSTPETMPTTPGTTLTVQETIPTAPETQPNPPTQSA